MTGWTVRAMRTTAGIAAAAAAALLAGISAQAAIASVATGPAPESFGIFPTPAPGSTKPAGDVELIVSPRHTYTASVSVVNYAAAATKFWLYAADAYTIKNGGGFAVQGMTATPHDVGAWVSPLPKVVTVPAGKQLNVAFTISVPGNATPGTHAGGIVIEDTTPQLIQVSSQVQVKRYVQRFARLYLTVTGEVSASFALNGLLVVHPQPPIPVVTHRTGLITYHIANTGNAIIAPVAQLTVTGLFGSTMTKTLPASGQILPGGVAAYSFGLQLPAFGPVHVHVTVRSAYGVSRVADYSYTAIPVLFLAVVAVIVVVFAVALAYVIRRRRRARQLAQPRKVPAVRAG